jgi:hypothetical protein
MFSVTAFAIRDAHLDDVPELARLGWSTPDAWPSGRILVGEIHGVVAAGLAIDENRAVAGDLSSAPRLLAHMRARGAGVTAWTRTASIAERIRERMRPPVLVDA